MVDGVPWRGFLFLILKDKLYQRGVPSVLVARHGSLPFYK